uniref:Uncharacterized protein n=1 Tax=Ditylenchus dipsaci TaxID=166011 RepID=A0A915D095_9BILA
MLAIEEVEANTGQYGTISMRRAMRRGRKSCDAMSVQGLQVSIDRHNLKRHWSKQHSEKEQPADRIGSHISAAYKMQESFGTMKEMLRVQFNSVRKSIKKKLQSYKWALQSVHVDTMFLDEPSEEEEDEENEEDELYSIETEILLQYNFYCLIAAISRI